MANSLEDYRIENVDHLDADERGRVTLGSEFADEKIFVAWSVVDMDGGVEVPEAERQKLKELWQWAMDNDYELVDTDPYEGKVFTTDAEWVDADVEGLATDA